PRRDLIYLLKKIEKIEGLKRIRLSSLDPRFLTDSFLKSITELSKIAHHFHLSFQSFSEIVLEGMNRKYSVKRYIEILNFLREKFPKACLGADIVIGFPYEDYTEFEKTYNLVKNSPLNYIHVFPFSPRKGTKAFLMKDINFEEKKRRAKLMRELSLAKRKEFHSSFLGKKLDGIVIKRYGDYAEVLTENYIKLITSSDGLREGDEVFLVVDESLISFYTQSGIIQDLDF
ncbi:MAG: radical SAM protein, partial [Candidatus Aminicenantia bacterium]